MEEKYKIVSRFLNDLIISLAASFYGALNAITGYFFGIFAILLVREKIGGIPNERALLLLLLFGAFGSYIYHTMKSYKEMRK